MESSIIYLSAREVVARIKAQEVSVVEVVTAFLDRIDQLNPAVNAISDLRTRKDILAEAEEKDEMLQAGNIRTLHGLPMTIKDCFWVKGLKTSNGHPAYRNYVAEEDAELVKRLKNAGVIVLGKTNVPLFSIDWQATNFWNGTTNNPYDLSRVPGGSSGGSAAAVAAGFSPIELGGDQGGSIRVPAHFCGICGICPTEHALPNRGHIRFPGKPQGHRHVSVAGPLAKTVDDLILALEVLWDNTRYLLAEIPSVSLDSSQWGGERLKIAVAESFNGVAIDQEYLEIFRQFVRIISEQGHHISSNFPQYDEEKAYQTCGKITGYEFDINMPRLPFSGAFMYWFIRLKYRDQQWARGIARGINISAKEYTEALAYKDFVADIYTSFLSEYDIWITPVAAIKAFKHQRAGKPFVINGKETGYTDAIASYNFTTALSGHPIVVIPIGTTKNGMPVGVQLHAKRWNDRRLLEVAKSFEKLIPGFSEPKIPVGYSKEA